MFGLSFEKILIIAGIGAFILGPSRLPVYAQKLGQLVRNLRGMADGARDRMRDEMGADVFDEIDWKKLDPRQYDPRRIIRDALLDDDVPAVAQPMLSSPAADDGVANTVIGASGVATRAASPRLAEGAVPPFDPEAT